MKKDNSLNIMSYWKSYTDQNNLVLTVSLITIKDESPPPPPHLNVFLHN